jgi:predicted TIM-barrel fold metal-dependent hydrolase
MRNGQRVYDADTHVTATAETLQQYIGPELRTRVPDLDEHRREFRIGWAGEKLEPPFRHLYSFAHRGGWGAAKPRVLGEAGPREGAEREFQKFMGRKFPTPGSSDWDPDARIRDMDEEGVDVHMMVPPGANGHEDPWVEMEFIRANNRYLNDFCSEYPHRLKSLIAVTPRSIEASVEEIKRWADSSWAVGVQPHLPLDYPLDHPDLEPIWKAADEAGMAVVHHSFATGYPGYRDLWDNPFLGRLASHPWAAMRAVAAFFGAGILDRYPNLRFCVLESGFGWLPFWARRMDDQVVYMGYVPENLQHKMSEYVTGGRFFASIVLHEGEEMVKMVADDLGDHLLMFGSDYPHAESRFPDSLDKVLAWQSLSSEQMRKLVWDNPVRCFGEP